MKIYKKIVVFLLLITFINVKAQHINAFYLEAYIAYKLAKNGEIDSAITTYENAFKKVDYVQITYLKSMVKLAKLNKDEERIKKYSQQIEKQSKGINPKLKAIIDSLIIGDQKVRKGKLYRRAKYSFRCDHKQNCNKQSKKYIKSKIVADNWRKTDSLNTHYLLNLFEQNGFIGEELVGYKGYVNVLAMLLHFDIDTNNTVLEPVLRKALNEGKILAIDFSIIIDRHLGDKYTIQKYWTWPYVGKEKLQFSEADIPKIIKLRESIGLYGLSLRQEEYRKGHWRLINKYNY
ncbi:MAG: hypothetical protein COA97_10420 [Flavobacteriales bacterium]|nr:MAG: hypothetical protein COA97_10420 [Flavobacteriales bacterium]